MVRILIPNPTARQWYTYVSFPSQNIPEKSGPGGALQSAASILAATGSSCATHAAHRTGYHDASVFWQKLGTDHKQTATLAQTFTFGGIVG